jgi:hypothetical protein
VLTAGRVNTSNPKGTEDALTITSVAISVLARAHNGLLGHTKDIVTPPAKAFRKGKNFLVTRTRGDSTFNSRHGLTPLRVGHHVTNLLQVGRMNSKGSTQLPLVFRCALGKYVALRGVGTLNRPTSTSHKALRSRLFGLHFGHLMLLVITALKVKSTMLLL